MKQHKQGRSKIKRRSAIITSIIALLLIIAIVVGHYLLSKVNRYAVGKITEAVQEHLGDRYEVHFGDLSFNLLRGDASITGFYIKPDSTAIAGLFAQGKAPHTLYSISSGRVDISIKHPWRNLRRNILEVRHIDIDDPRVEIMRDSTRKDTTFAVHGKIFRLPFESVTVDEINVRNGFMSYSRQRTQDTLSHRLERVGVKVESLSLDSTFTFSSLIELPVDNITCDLRGYSLSPAGEACTLGLARLVIDMKRQSISIDSLSFTPDYEKAVFAQKTRSHADWAMLEVGHIDVYGINFRTLMDHKQIVADSIAISSANVESYKNRKIAAPQREKPLFHHLLQKVRMPVSVGKVIVGNTSAKYEELSANGVMPGVISLKSINAVIDSATNVPSDSRDYYTIDARADIMGGALHAVFRFPIEAGNEHFEVGGTLSKVNMENFNPMIEPLANIKVGKGVVNKLYFDMEADDKAGIVDMRFLYDSLQVDILNKAGMRSWLGSGLVNNMVVIDDNPEPGKEVREVHATAERDPYRSHFNYLWRMAFAGIKESVGLTEKKQEQFASIQKKLQQMKQNREERKEKRAENKKNR